ncbi:MAG TPA: NAD(P)H-binding protein [Novosphingobium sp.]|nr:NAD(P)H-binding protein [Novosphingobium sp.]
MARNSLHGKLVAVVGGSGFMGRHLAQELLDRGARLRVISRDVERANAIKPLGMLGQVQLLRGDVRKADELAGLLAGADAVVNLAGTFAGDLDAVMGSGAGAVAGAARAAGAGALVHVSAIGADAGGETAYARAKAAGEAAVLAAFPAATVLRPSVLFGPDDTFINRFAGLIARFPAMPVFAPQAELQPVFVDDVALAIANALGDPADHGGKTYEVAGPERLTMAQLNRMIAKAARRAPLFLDLPDGVSGLIVTLTGWLPGAPISGQQWKLLKAGNAASGDLPGLKELGVSARPLGLFLDRWLVRFRKHGRFGD